MSATMNEEGSCWRQVFWSQISLIFKHLY